MKIYIVLLFLILFVLFNLLNANSLASNETIETAIVAPESALAIKKTIGNMLIYRFEAEIKGKKYNYVATNKTEYLFISPYTRYYSFNSLTKSFYFGDLKFNETVLNTVFDSLNLTQNKDAARWFQNWEEAKILNNKILTDVLNSTGLSKYDFVVCDETFKNYFEIPIGSPERQLLMSKSYYCCDSSNSCKWIRQSDIMALVHFIFAAFKFIITMGIIRDIRKRASSLWIDSYEAQHVTCSYMTPPFWVYYLLPPFLKRRAYDIRFWIRGIVVSTLLFVFGLNIIHSMAPLDWPKSNDGSNDWRSMVISQAHYFGSVIINGQVYPGMWLFIFIIFPIAAIVASITTACYLNAPRGSYEDYLLSKEVDEYPSKLYRRTRIIETVIRAFISLPLSAISSFFIMFFLLKSHEVYEYNDTYMFTSGGVLFLIILFYLLTSPIFISISNLAWEIKSQAKKTQENIKHLNLKRPLRGNGANKKEAQRDLPPNTTYLLMIIPSIIFEAAWFNSVYLLTYIATSVFTRLIWSLMLMVILYPDTLQTMVFLATILGTIVQFAFSLAEPHKKVKAMMLDELPLVPKGYVKDNNAWLMSMDIKEIQRRTLSKESHSYFVYISWKHFHDWCAQMKVSYFVWLKVLQMFFTLFVLSLFFFGAIVFDFSSSGSSDILKLGMITLMPLVPRVVELIDRNDQVMESAFKKRWRGAAGAHGNNYAPPEVQVPHKKQYGVHPTSAVLKPIPWVKKHVKFTDDEGNAILETFVIPDTEDETPKDSNNFDYFESDFEPPSDYSIGPGRSFELGNVNTGGSDSLVNRGSNYQSRKSTINPSHTLIGSDFDSNSNQNYHQFNDKSIRV